MERILYDPVVIALGLVIFVLILVLLCVISWGMKKNDRLIIEKEQEYDRGYAEGARKMMSEYSRNYEMTE